MQRALVVVPALVLLMPEPSAHAGPPDAPSGVMVLLDQVADGLRRYRRETTPEKRIWWLKKLAPSKDARVAVALGEAATSDDLDVSQWAIRLVFQHYDMPSSEDSGAAPIRGIGCRWRRQNESQLRGQAARLAR